MRQRSIPKMILLSIVTLGIYSVYWSVSTKNEMNRLGAQVPTAWLLVIPLVNIYWMWKYSQAVEQITGTKISAPLAFVVEYFLGFIGDLIIQTEFNKLATAPVADSSQPYGPPVDSGPLPDNTFGGPVAEAPQSTPAPYTPAPPPAPYGAPVPPAIEQPAPYTPPAAPAEATQVTVGSEPAAPQPPFQAPPQA